MAEIKTKYGAATALTIGAWVATLLADEWATSAIVDNRTTLFVDVLVGGFIELGTTTPAPGDTLEIYVVGNYDPATNTDMTAGIDALFGANNEEIPGVGFMKENLRHIETVAAEANEGYHFGPTSITGSFNGIVPPQWMLVLHNNSGAPLAAGSNCSYIGITYTSA